jgi:hypothetical protein
MAKQKTNFTIPIDDDSVDEWYDHKAWPWVASLIIAFITVGVNLYISLATRKTSLYVVQRQIDSAVSIAKVQFQSSLSSKNRQDWINDVRNCISELAAHARQANIYYQDPEQDKSLTFTSREKAFLYKSKLKLLLTPKISEHAAYLQAQDELMKVLEIHMLNNLSRLGQFDNQEFSSKLEFMLDKGRELLYSEWQKVQRAI